MCSNITAQHYTNSNEAMRMDQISERKCVNKKTKS